MPITAYTYSISADFPGGAVNIGKLDAEVKASAIVTTHLGVNRANDVLEIVFADALSEADKTILDGDMTGPAGGLIAAHDNTADIVTTFIASSLLFEGPKSVTSNPTFEEVGGIITDPLSTLWGLSASQAKGRITCQVKVSGSGAELKLVECHEGGVSPVDLCTAQAVADTGGAWKGFQFTTTVDPRAALVGEIGNEYTLHGRLNGATSMEVRFASLVLLKVE